MYVLNNEVNFYSIIHIQFIIGTQWVVNWSDSSVICGLGTKNFSFSLSRLSSEVPGGPQIRVSNTQCWDSNAASSMLPIMRQGNPVDVQYVLILCCPKLQPCNCALALKLLTHQIWLRLKKTDWQKKRKTKWNEGKEGSRI